jgi:hypothetical protein
MRAGKFWPAAMAAVAILVLLGAFDRAVRQVVNQATLRRAAEAQRFDAAWRCNLLRGRAAREACRAGVP